MRLDDFISRGSVGIVFQYKRGERRVVESKVDVLRSDKTRLENGGREGLRSTSMYNPLSLYSQMRMDVVYGFFTSVYNVIPYGFFSL